MTTLHYSQQCTVLRTISLFSPFSVTHLMLLHVLSPSTSFYFFPSLYFSFMIWGFDTWSAWFMPCHDRSRSCIIQVTVFLALLKPRIVALVSIWQLLCVANSYAKTNIQYPSLLLYTHNFLPNEVIQNFQITKLRGPDFQFCGTTHNLALEILLLLCNHCK